MKNTCLTLCACFLIIIPMTGYTQDILVRLSVDQAVMDAIVNHPAVKEAGEYVHASRQALLRSRADFFPTVAMNYAFTGLDKQPIMKTAQGETFTAYDRQYAWGLTLTQPLFTGFALSSAQNISKLGITDKEIQKEMVILDLARDVRIACYNLLLSQKMLVVAQSEVDSLEAHKDVALKFYTQELIPKNDLLRSEVALADSIQNLEKRRAGVDSAIALLNTLLNADVNRQVKVEDVDQISDFESELEPLTRIALEQRPVIRALKNILEQSMLAEKLAKSGRYPMVYMVGKYGRNGDDFMASDNNYTNSENTSIYLQVNWTLFDWGKTSAGIKQAMFQTIAIREKIKETESLVKLEAKNALLNLEVAKKNIKTAQKALGQARENLRVTNAQYAQQITTSDVVLDARSFLTLANTNYYQALYGYMASITHLDRALGDFLPKIPKLKGSHP